MVHGVLTEKPKMFSLKKNDDCHIQLDDLIFSPVLELHVFKLGILKYLKSSEFRYK